MFPYNQNDKLIFVNINKSYDAFCNNDRTNYYYRQSVYDCTNKYWRIADEKASQATHVLGCYKGIVKEVIKIESVEIVTEGDLKGRKIFAGTSEDSSPYLGLDLHEVFDSLANFQTKYWNL